MSNFEAGSNESKHLGYIQLELFTNDLVAARSVQTTSGRAA